MLNAMRLLDGISLQQFAERTGLPLTSIDGGLTQAEQKGLLTRTLTHVKPTVRGMDFLSDLQTLFLPG